MCLVHTHTHTHTNPTTQIELAGLRGECAVIDMDDVHMQVRLKHAQRVAAAQEAAAQAAAAAQLEYPGSMTNGR